MGRYLGKVMVAGPNPAGGSILLTSNVAVCLVGLLVLPSSARGLYSGLREFLIIAHRGASGYAPENTLAAFAKALAVGANVIEVDIRQSKDGHLRPDGSGWNRNGLSRRAPTGS